MAATYTIFHKNRGGGSFVRQCTHRRRLARLGNRPQNEEIKTHRPLKSGIPLAAPGRDTNGAFQIELIQLLPARRLSSEGPITNAIAHRVPLRP